MMLAAKNLKVGYDERVIIEDLNLKFGKGEVAAIIGPNGCGKSTLLKTLSRMILPMQGEVCLEGENIKNIKRKELSQKLCLLSQFNQAPEDITVEQLVYYGRIPHKKWYEMRTKEDDELVNWAVEETGLIQYKDTPIGALSGGERQRAYIAQALCRKPDILLLDEPTTHLDISYQLELMELIREINEKLNITIVMVLHDLNQASRYSDRLVMMKDGAIIVDGRPKEVITQEMMCQVYGVKCEIDHDPRSGKPRIYPTATIKEGDNYVQNPYR